MVRHAHLVGSVGLSDAETVFTTVSEILGPCCQRIPDGETADRGYWIRWQRDTFASHPDFEEAITTNALRGFKDSIPRTFFKLRKGVTPEKLTFGQLGYARAAEASFDTFKRLMKEGKVAANVRFQVSLPTPVALLCGFIIESERRTVEHAIERAILSEVDLIQRSIPPDRLSIQWDVCYEVVAAEYQVAAAAQEKLQLPYADAVAGAISRIGRLCGNVKPKTELGVHLCYGDPGHKHIVEPIDLGLCVTFANGICQASPRSIDFIHMPVPRDRADETYFRPLKQLALPSSTRLILGLIHHTDGVEGSRKRIAAAERYVEDFDVATECGFGRRNPATIPELLGIHKELCRA